MPDTVLILWPTLPLKNKLVFDYYNTYFTQNETDTESFSNLPMMLQIVSRIGLKFR